jgi:hypothetical protein
MQNGKSALTKGAIDADGHILEPADLWETHLEPKYRDRALRMRTNSDGMEILEIEGKRSWTGLSRLAWPAWRYGSTRH